MNIRVRIFRATVADAGPLLAAGRIVRLGIAQ
jgi:hypothetical protein